MTESHDPPQRPTVRQGGELLPGRHPGDRTLRIIRPETQQIPVPPRVRRRASWHPALVFVNGFAALIAVGAFLLAIPPANASGEWTPVLVALFTATSAVCVTGLVVVDTGTYWTPLGHAIILLLVQLGGFGFMAASTLLLLLLGHHVSLRERLLLRESLGSGNLQSVVPLVRKIFLFTLATELLGTLILTGFFLSHLEGPDALWWGFFHAVSAFNNAGFDLVGGFHGIVPYAAEPVLVLTVAGLLFSGGISFIVLSDTWRFVRSRLNRRPRLSGHPSPGLHLDTRLVLSGSAALIVLGTLALLVTERSNTSTLGAMDPSFRVMNAFFMTVTRTAGFATVPVGEMTEESLFVLIALMFIGGSAGSTAGGIKLQTFGLLFCAILSAIRGLDEVEAFRRRVPNSNVLRALAVALLALALVFSISLALTLAEHTPFLPVLFEAFSAFSTVGLSTGITPTLSPIAQIILVATMFVGRLGPLTLILALAARQPRATYQWPEATVRIG